MPKDRIPILKAMSLLAHGDDDYRAHWVPVITIGVFSEDERERGVEYHDPEFLAFATRLCGPQQTDWDWPEGEQAKDRIFELAARGVFKLVARKVYRDDSRKQPDRSGEFHVIPPELVAEWLADGWRVESRHPYRIYKPYVRAPIGIGGVFEADWCDLHVDVDGWSELERLLAGDPPRTPTNETVAPPVERPLKQDFDDKISELIRRHCDERKAIGLHPNKGIVYRDVKKNWPEGWGRPPSRKRLMPFFDKIAGTRGRGERGRKFPEEIPTK